MEKSYNGDNVLILYIKYQAATTIIKTILKSLNFRQEKGHESESSSFIVFL